jgi:hypothetical protein
MRWTLAAPDLRLEGGREAGGIGVEETNPVTVSEVLRVAAAQFTQRLINRRQ